MKLEVLTRDLPNMSVVTLQEAMATALEANNADLRGAHPAAVRVLAREFLLFRQEVARIWAKADSYGAPGADSLFSVLQKHNPFADGGVSEGSC